MKYALYFLGCCFLVWAATIYWCVSLAIGVVHDAKDLVQHAPALMDRAEIVIQDARKAGDALQDQISRARGLVSLETVKKLGSGAADKADETLKSGLFHISRFARDQ